MSGISPGYLWDTPNSYLIVKTRIVVPDCKHRLCVRALCVGNWGTDRALRNVSPDSFGP